MHLGGAASLAGACRSPRGPRAAAARRRAPRLACIGVVRRLGVGGAPRKVVKAEAWGTVRPVPGGEGVVFMV